MAVAQVQEKPRPARRPLQVVPSVFSWQTWTGGVVVLGALNALGGYLESVEYRGNTIDISATITEASQALGAETAGSILLAIPTVLALRAVIGAYRGRLEADRRKRNWERLAPDTRKRINFVTAVVGVPLTVVAVSLASALGPVSFVAGPIALLGAASLVNSARHLAGHVAFYIRDKGDRYLTDFVREQIVPIPQKLWWVPILTPLSWTVSKLPYMSWFNLAEATATLVPNSIMTVAAGTGLLGYAMRTRNLPGGSSELNPDASATRVDYFYEALEANLKAVKSVFTRNPLQTIRAMWPTKAARETQYVEWRTEIQKTAEITLNPAVIKGIHHVSFFLQNQAIDTQRFLLEILDATPGQIDGLIGSAEITIKRNEIAGLVGQTTDHNTIITFLPPKVLAEFVPALEHICSTQTSSPVATRVGPLDSPELRLLQQIVEGLDPDGFADFFEGIDHKVAAPAVPPAQPAAAPSVTTPAPPIKPTAVGVGSFSDDIRTAVASETAGPIDGTPPLPPGQRSITMPGSTSTGFPSQATG